MWLDRLLARNLLPDWLIRIGIRRLLAQRLRDETGGSVEAQSDSFRALVADLRSSPIAVETAAANEQHYEVPAAFYQASLGPRLKYSSAYWPEGVTTLAAAEEAMLALTCSRAELSDGQRILELGCGWGSLTLWMAERYPNATITGVSNSSSQKAFITDQARRRGLNNVTIVTCDANVFQPEGQFDRIVSVEMFEHMRNFATLLERISGWLRPEGKLFVHIFTHRTFAYRFEGSGASDWMARNFFTGGIMPSDDLLLRFQGSLDLEDHWRLSGKHYQRTAEAWLENADRNQAACLEALAHSNRDTPPAEQFAAWRVFFMACAELWGYRGGEEWLVSHYRFRARARATNSEVSSDRPSEAEASPALAN
jgi:cyclopropane-fatty-acyl-phospholipid synthase